MNNHSQSPIKQSDIYLDKNGNTIFHKAVKDRNLSMIYFSATKEYSIINQQNRDGYSALHYAVKHEDISVIEAVLQCGIDPLLKTKLSQTASEMARVNKRSDIADLIELYCPGLNQTISEGDKSKTIDLLKKWVSLANVANSMKHCQIFRHNLLSMRLDYYDNQNKFIHSVASDNLDAVCSFQNDAKQPIRHLINSTHIINGQTPLALAISNSSVKMVQLLLEMEADPTIRLVDGTPLIHYAWNQSAPFTILIALLNINQRVWHMRCPRNGLTILFLLSSWDTITPVHIHKVLEITKCRVLRDRDIEGHDFYEFCKLHNRDDLIEIMWESIAELVGKKSGKIELIHLATSQMGETVLAVPEYIFKRIYIDSHLESILLAYEKFMGNVCSLQNECTELIEAVRQGNLIKVKLHNIADFIDKTGRTALHEAILFDQLEITQWLLTERPTLLMIPDTFNRYPFHYAYGVIESFGKKYVHLLLDMRVGVNQEWLTDMNNCVPSSINFNIHEEIKINLNK